MAAGGLLALLDDLTSILDDVAALSKVAAQKTAGISGDDLAVNAQMLTGLEARRELPIVWAVAKGSFKNKCYLVPGALFLNWAAAWTITPLLMLGGLYLCFEGAEKILHTRSKKSRKALTAAAVKSAEDLLTLEKDKIRQAINTDLILSAEIVAIALSTVAAKPFMTQATVLCVIAIAMTVGVYGLVAGIVKLDDFGLYLSRKKRRWQKNFGGWLVRATPGMMKIISIVGTAAMFMVGGGILLHGIPGLGHALPDDLFLRLATEALAGVIAGLAVIGAIKPLNKAKIIIMKK